jgi:hypothetical protein
MSKIPVGETISEAYSFGFTRFLSVLGVTWFPYLVTLVACVGLAYLAAPDLFRQLSHGQFDPTVFVANLPHLLGVASLTWILFFIASCMVRVGLLRLALGLHPGPVFIFFSLGSEVWMMVGAIFLAVLVAILVGVLTAAAVAAIMFGSQMIHVAAAARGIDALAIIAGVLWFVYFYVRLMFFLPAVVVAEKEVGLGRSWTLGGGNFWRIVIIAIVVFVPVAIGFGMVESAITGPFMIQTDIFQHPDQLTPQTLSKALAHDLALLGPLYFLLAFIRTILFEGLGAGVVGSAYRGVAPAAAA